MNTVNKILQLVDESGLTAKDYAINAGLGAGNITDWKTGRSKPSVESLQKIAKYAKVNLEWLTGDSKYKTKEEENQHNEYILSKSIISQATLDTLDNFLVLGLTQKEIFKIRDLLIPMRGIDLEKKEREILSFLDTYPEESRDNIKNAMIELLHRNGELLQIEQLKSIEKETSHLYMTPVYRFYFSRNT